MAEAIVDGSGIFVPARRIPVPITISTQAQGILSSIPELGHEPFPPMADVEAWGSYIDKTNKAIIGFTKQQAQTYPAKVASHKLSFSNLYESTPENLDPERDDFAILYLHGGGFIMGGGDAAIYAAWPIASLARTRIYSLDYRMIPEHPYPAALDDAVEA